MNQGMGGWVGTGGLTLDQSRTETVKSRDWGVRVAREAAGQGAQDEGLQANMRRWACRSEADWKGAGRNAGRRAGRQACRQACGQGARRVRGLLGKPRGATPKKGLHHHHHRRARPRHHTPTCTHLYTHAQACP